MSDSKRLRGPTVRLGLAVRANGRLAHRCDATGVVSGVAAMGAALKVVVVLALAAIITACGRISDDTVRDKDQQRIETSKVMPGNDIPLDPADGR
jgi:hypothetical protein